MLTGREKRRRNFETIATESYSRRVIIFAVFKFHIYLVYFSIWHKTHITTRNSIINSAIHSLSLSRKGEFFLLTFDQLQRLACV